MLCKEAKLQGTGLAGNLRLPNIQVCFAISCRLPNFLAFSAVTDIPVQDTLSCQSARFAFNSVLSILFVTSKVSAGWVALLRKSSGRQRRELFFVVSKLV